MSATPSPLAASGDRSLARTAAALAPHAVALLPFAWLAWRFDWLCDDAFISFRYARHLAEGQGLRFNPGESPPVEGYSNFLWVVVLGLAERLGVHAGTAARVLSGACGAALVLTAVEHVRRRLGGGLPAFAAAAFLGFLPPLAVWTTGGLATMPFALALFVAFDRLTRDPGRPRGVAAGAALALACLLRADGFGFAGLLVGGALVAAALGRDRALARAALGAAGIAAAVVLAHLAWRWSYHEALAPNTAKAKVSLGEMLADAEVRDAVLLRGRNYLASFALAFPSVPLAVLVGLLGLARERRATVAALSVVLGTAAYAWLVGGDFMAFGRFLVPTLAFAAMALAAGLDGLRATARTGVAVVLAAAVAAALLPAFDRDLAPRSLRNRFHFRWNESRQPPEQWKSEYAMWRFMRDNALGWSYLGRALALHVQPGESMTLGPVGAVGYHTELVLYDSYGLTHREAAESAVYQHGKSAGHDRSVPGTFFDRYRPTYYSATIVATDDPLATLPRDWREDPGHLERFELQFDELLPAQGFPPNATLLRIRNRW